jgi:hypothetical protein
MSTKSDSKRVTVIEINGAKITIDGGNYIDLTKESPKVAPQYDDDDNDFQPSRNLLTRRLTLSSPLNPAPVLKKQDNLSLQKAKTTIGHFDDAIEELEQEMRRMKKSRDKYKKLVEEITNANLESGSDPVEILKNNKKANKDNIKKYSMLVL